MPGPSKAFLLALLCLSGPSSNAQATAQVPSQNEKQEGAAPQTNPADETFDQQKKFAFILFNQNHHLEALPIFQDLAKRNPGDADVLFGYGACLMDHSATVRDETAARAERLQARELLLQAKQLGCTAGLLMNLLELLPADGSMRYPGGPEVVAAIQEGEAEFARNNYQAAIEHYSRAFALDPKSYTSALFIGDSYFGAKDFPKAGEWYEKAIAINPDVETAYRYACDMYTKNGNQAKAREMAISAIVAEPYSNLPWRGLAQWATVNHLQLTRVYINTHSEIASDGSAKSTINWDPNSSPNILIIWMMYNGTRQNWRKEEFKKNYPQEAEYRHTLAEEVAALKKAAFMLPKDKPDAIASDPDLALLKKLSDAAMLEPYVLLSAPDRGIAIDYVAYRQTNRKQLKDYLNQFVVPPAPAPAKQ